MDFIINQTYSENEELKRDRYVFVTNNRNQSYIKDTDKDLSVIKNVNKKRKWRKN